MSDDSQQRDIWLQSRIVWVGIAAIIVGFVFAVSVPDVAGLAIGLMVFGGICILLWLLRKFFSRR